jgi:hypothetical protein
MCNGKEKKGKLRLLCTKRETNEAFRDSFVIHWAYPILFFDLNDFWGFPYQTMDFAISFIWECRHAPFTTSLKPMNGCKIR